MKPRRAPRWRRRLLAVLTLLAGLTLALAVLFQRRMNPVLEDMARALVDNVASNTINAAIDEQIANGTVDYNRLVLFEKDLNGRITAIKTNMTEVNRLKTQVLDIINDTLLEISTDELRIPIGNLIFPEIFSGRGPGIPVRIVSVSTSDASFRNAFSSAGINQTCHQIILSVEVGITALLPADSLYMLITSEMVVAETVIVGDVPSTYANFGSEP